MSVLCTFVIVEGARFGVLEFLLGRLGHSPPSLGSMGLPTPHPGPLPLPSFSDPFLGL